VALVRTDVSEENIASIIKVKCINGLGVILVVILFLRCVLQFLVTDNGVPISPILSTLMMEAILFSKTSVLTRVMRHCS
jgi:hypothetical protein